MSNYKKHVGVFDKPLPSNLDAEKIVLASILTDTEAFAKVSLLPEDFSIEYHRLIFRRMQELKEESEPVDRITLINLLTRYGELQKAGGVGYIVDLDSGMPAISNIEAHARIVKDHSIRRKVIFASRAAMDAAYMSDTSVNSLLSSTSRAISGLEVDSGVDNNLLSIESIFAAAGGMQEFYTNTIKPGISTGFPQVDDFLMGGLQEGCQYVVGGSTSSGKTVLVSNVITNLAQAGYPCGLWSMEMGKEIILMRMACALSGVPLKAVIKKGTNKEQRDLLREASLKLAKLPIFIDETPVLTCSDLVRRVNKAVRERGLRMFGLDYLQLVEWQNDKTMRFRDEYSAFTYASKTTAMLTRQHNISSLVLSQLSRPKDKKKASDPPTRTDLKASGSIENDATGIILVHRPELYKPGDEELRGKAELIVAKSRNGSTGTAHVVFEGKYTRFIDHGKPFGLTGDDE